MIHLTPKELKVIALLAAGKTNREIARELGHSYETTKNHIYNIYAKVGCKSRVECVVWWMRRNDKRERASSDLRRTLAKASRLLSKLHGLLD